MKIWRWGWLVGVLVGCAALPPQSVVPIPSRATRWEIRQATLLPRAHFALTGRVAMRRGKEGADAKLQWQQSGARFDLRLGGPLGQGTIRLTGDDQSATLLTEDRVYTAPDLDALMTAHLKWSLPVAGVRYWILGLPVPGRAFSALTLDDQGRLSGLIQDGWRISVLEYRIVGGVDLPSKLVILGGDAKLRLVISDW